MRLLAHASPPPCLCHHRHCSISSKPRLAAARRQQQPPRLCAARPSGRPAAARSIRLQHTPAATATTAPTTDRQQQQPRTPPPPPTTTATTTAVLPVPLDFYACLGVTRTAGSRAVRSALEKALLQRPAAYFSPDTVALRDLLLRTAADCLENYEKRRDYDASAQTASGYVVSVSQEHLPGALVLLQESGCDQLVLDIGAQWLPANRQDALRQDVTSVMALAHRSLAMQALQSQDGSGTLLQACRHLESALLLIRQSIRSSQHAGAAADFQQDVMQLLKDYSPDYCLALLALRLGDPQRQRGHSLLRKLLFELPEELCPLRPELKDDFLAAARPLITAQEHLTLSKARGSSTSAMQRQLVAEAMVAVAFQQRQPLMLMQAAVAFKELEQEGGGGAAADMCVERACIALLLGDTSQAPAELGLEPAAAGASNAQQQQEASSATQQAARDYVLAHCPDSTDLLPGVYALAQCWMQQGILGAFRQQEGAAAAQQGGGADDSPLDLAPWFDSPLVRLVILALAVVAWIKQCVQAAAGMPAAAAASLVWLQRRLAAEWHAKQRTAEAAAGSGSRSEAAAHRSAAVRGVDPSAKSISSATSRSSSSSPGGAGAAATASSAAQQPVKPAQAAAEARRRPQSHPSTLQQREEELSPEPTQQQQEQRQSGYKLQSRRQPGMAPSQASAAAGDDDGTLSLMARVRAAAAKGGSVVEEEELSGAELSASSAAAVHRRLSQQMVEVEALMWDPVAPEPSGWRATASKAMPVVLLAVAAVLAAVLAGSSKGRQQPAGNSAPLGPSTLLFEARG